MDIEIKIAKEIEQLMKSIIDTNIDYYIKHGTGIYSGFSSEDIADIIKKHLTKI